MDIHHFIVGLCLLIFTGVFLLLNFLCVVPANVIKDHETTQKLVILLLFATSLPVALCVSVGLFPLAKPQ